MTEQPSLPSSSSPSSKRRKIDDDNHGGKKNEDELDLDDVGVQTIREGSTTMSYPANQESSVFYNPVQVQNRDLSTLMITLFAERRAKRFAVNLKKKQLNRQNNKQKAKKNTGDGDAAGGSGTKLSQQQIKEQLEEYEKTLSGRQLLEEEERKIQDGRRATADGDGDAGDRKGITILDALAASGLRSIRYWKEIRGVKHVTINDLEEAAIERAKDNLRRNQIPGELVLSNNEERKYGICVNHGDAMHELYMSRRPQQNRNPTALQQKQQPMWDVIDLDPYGSAAPFIDGAVQAVEDGGMLCVTCTDMPALGGAHPETAFGRYASLPIQSAQYLQELALRILLHTIAVSAARYGRSIRPVLSVGMDFYIRCFVEIRDDKKSVMDLSLKLGHVYQSTQCSTFITLPHGQMGGKKSNVYQSIRLTQGSCPETGSPWKIGGPAWLGPLHDQDVVREALGRLSDPDCTAPNMKLIATRKRLLGLLTSVSEELDVPLFYSLPDICKKLHCSSPPMKQFKAAIVNAGYKVSGYHKDPNAIKTDAPHNVIWDIMRTWIKDRSPLKKEPQKESAAAKILAVEPTTKVDFTPPTTKTNDATTKFSSSDEKISRFPLNPQTHWGPKRKASNKVQGSDDDA